MKLLELAYIVLLESGNAPGVNSFIDKKYYDTTVSYSNKVLGFSSIKLKPLGNTTKAYMGDIDLAISMKDLANVIGTKNPKTFWSDLDSYLKTKKVKQYVISKGLSQFSIAIPMMNSSNVQQNIISDRNGTVDKKGLAFVQVDYMIGDVQWMSDILSSNPDSKYKGAHRNIFLMSILSNIFLHTSGDAGVKKKTQINFKQGFQIADLGVTPRGRITKSNIKTITKDLSKVASFLFGKGVTKSDISSFEDMWKLFKGNKFKFPSQRSAIIIDLKRRIQSVKGLDEPDELK